jgi:hypothetical protein
MSSTDGAGVIISKIEELEHFINEWEIVPATRYYRSRVLLALMSKALTVGRAVCELVKMGFHGEAYGLSRTLAEIFFTVRFICNKDTEARAEKYFKYTTTIQKEFERLYEKHYLNKPVGKRNSYEWTGLRGQARQMALEDDSFEMDANGMPIKNEFDYDLIYWWTSQFVHGTVGSLFGHMAEPGETFRVRQHIGAEDGRGTEAVYNVAVFISRLFIYACRAMREAQPDEILRETLTFAATGVEAAKHENQSR